MARPPRTVPRANDPGVVRLETSDPSETLDWETPLTAMTETLRTISSTVEHLSRRCNSLIESFRRWQGDMHVDLVHQRLKMAEIERAISDRVVAAEIALSSKLDARVTEILGRQQSIQAIPDAGAREIRPVLVGRDVLVTKVDDFILAVPREEWTLAAYYVFWGTLERGMTVYLESILKPGMVFVDIGANIGIHTLHAARAVGIEGMVHSFEPTPGTFRVLQQNVRANRLKRVELYPLALLDRSCEVLLYQVDGMCGWNSIFAGGDSGAPVMVKATTLDEAIPHGRIDVIKIDAEGAEPFIWRGMQRILAENPRIRILIEFAPIHLRRAGVEPDQFLHDIAVGSFAIHRIEDESGDLIPFNPAALGPGDGANLLLERPA
jgi:FkbM family methyltransferase